MENKYYRITAYCPEDNFSFIVDSNGMFEKLWQFSASLMEKGLEVIEVSRLENIIDINIKQATEDCENYIIRATADGMPKNIEQIVNGITYKAIQVADKIYIPDKEQKI